MINFTKVQFSKIYFENPLASKIETETGNQQSGCLFSSTLLLNLLFFPSLPLRVATALHRCVHFSRESSRFEFRVSSFSNLFSLIFPELLISSFENRSTRFMVSLKSSRMPAYLVFLWNFRIGFEKSQNSPSLAFLGFFIWKFSSNFKFHFHQGFFYQFIRLKLVIFRKFCSFISLEFAKVVRFQLNSANQNGVECPRQETRSDA